MEVLLNKLFDKHSEGYGVYDRENLIKDICKELQNLQLQQTGVMRCFSDDHIGVIARNIAKEYAFENEYVFNRFTEAKSKVINCICISVLNGTGKINF